MSKKSFLGWGLFLGGAATATYLAFKRLDSGQQKQVIAKVNNGVHSLKKRAVDYAFYASDAIDDVKQTVDNKVSGAKQSLDDATDKLNDRKKDAADDNGEDQNSQFKTAADRLKDELNEDSTDSADDDDILVNSADALNNKNKVETFYPDHSKDTNK